MQESTYGWVAWHLGAMARLHGYVYPMRQRFYWKDVTNVLVLAFQILPPFEITPRDKAMLMSMGMLYPVLIVVHCILSNRIECNVRYEAFYSMTWDFCIARSLEYGLW